ncbi:MAG: general secretion pathway protein GspB [Xanthomonadales bacterium]|nr:general secretion pathway protein GspB [Xanthomonadales bacterium]
MSILLDALKKSEEQRRLGETPTIHSGGGGQVFSDDDGRRWIPLGLLTLSAVTVAWFGWQQFREPPAPLGTMTVAGAPQPGSADAEPATQASPDVELAQAQPKVRTPVESFRPDSSAGPQAGAGSGENERGAGQASAAPASSAAGAAAVDSRALAREDAPQQAATSQAGSNAAQPSTQRAAMEPHVSEPISYWELPQGMRDSLPEFRITVLVFAKQPEDRFLLINGQRLVEQEELSDGVKLDEIRRDGAVFLYRNYRFLVRG